MAMNLKKSSFITLGLMLGSLSFAGTMGAELVPYDGVYIGGNLGLLAAFQKISVAINGTAPGPFLGSYTQSTGHYGFTGGGMVGYDYSLQQKIKLGVEAYLNGVSTSIAQSQLSIVPRYDYGSITLRQNYAWGIRALPGYEFYPGVVGHVVLGYANAHFAISAPAPATGLGLYQPIVNQSLHRSGFQSGLGLTALVYHNFSLRIDGLFTSYGTLTSPAFAYSNGTSTYTGTFSSVLRTFESEVTLSYKFAS